LSLRGTGLKSRFIFFDGKTEMLRKTAWAQNSRILFNCAAVVCVSATAVTTTPATAQQPTSTASAPKPAAVQELPRVTVTGSAIRRIDAETAVPVVILKIENLKQQGLTTAEQIVTSLTAVQTQMSTSQSVGGSLAGASFADLHSMGSNKTLVLLNGRRIANNALDGSAPDLNVIPYAALERVELLHDGASSLYGSDAVGGVINFITRRDYTGGTLTLGGDIPQQAGGQSKNFNLGYGLGNLEADGYNVFGFIDYQQQRAITAAQRNLFEKNPRLSGTTFPANYYQDVGTYNPSAPACNAAAFLVSDGDAACSQVTSRFIDYVPKSRRISGLLRAELKLPAQHALSLEYFAAQSQVSTTTSPALYSLLEVRPGTPFYPGNGLTPAPPEGSDIDTTKPVFIDARSALGEPRKDKNHHQQQRLLLALDGSFAGWDYQTGAAYNENKVQRELLSGFSSDAVINNGVESGVINPFGNQTPAGAALLNAARVQGQLRSGLSTTSGVDVRASRDLGDWLSAGRPAAMAVGAEWRHEKISQQANTELASQVFSATGFDANTLKQGFRRVSAAYAELMVPVLKQLELTASVRHDHYSGVGGTTNPKLSLRYTPAPEFLLRTSYSTGFVAPTLYDLNAAPVYVNLQPFNDPVRCPGGEPIAGVSKATNCGVSFLGLAGGNKQLKPEKSKTANLGFVLQPSRDLNLSLDFWWINLRQQIGLPTDSTLFSNPNAYASSFKRAPDGSLSTDFSQCPDLATCGYVDLRTQNSGSTYTSGLDLSGNYRLRAGDLGTFQVGLNSTYTTKYDYQDVEGGAWSGNVGVFSGTGPVFRWQHRLSGTWARGPFSAGSTLHAKSGYVDQNSSQDEPPRRVSSHSTLDIFGAWQTTQVSAPVTTFTLGVKNLLNREAPYSNQSVTFQSGYDPRYYDPTGRTFYLRIGHRF
jgi:iron complex outermembrane recepter protein